MFYLGWVGFKRAVLQAPEPVGTFMTVLYALPMALAIAVLERLRGAGVVKLERYSSKLADVHGPVCGLLRRGRLGCRCWVGGLAFHCAKSHREANSQHYYYKDYQFVCTHFLLPD